MRGAGNAGVVIADALLAAVADDVIGLIDDHGGDGGKIGFDARLVLRGRRHDARVFDGAVGCEVIAVPADAARRLGAAKAGAGARFERHRGLRPAAHRRR